LRSMQTRRTALLGLAGTGALLLSGCKIVPIAGDDDAQGGGFDAEAYADGLWAERVLPHFAAAAKPLPDVVQAIAADLDAAGETLGYRAAAEGSPWSFIVTGTGRVTAKNTQSRAGTLVLAVDGVPAEVTIQIGPVVRGNAVRDSLPFVSFKEFTNQLEFADVGKALTARALAATEADAAAATVGQAVTFTGAMSLNAKGDKLLVTPVSLAVAG